MPAYDYRCLTCSEITEKFRPVADCMICPPCSVCGGETKKIISAYRVHPDMEPYFDDNLETYIKSKKHRRKVMQEKGVSEKFGKGWM